ncbi:MAG: hypothetical protein NZ893_00350 [Candidatus Aenigmarchaeota archaeon]|nr:hypothetical protein [Candidatus Aenigmarchaeota archaeon]
MESNVNIKLILFGLAVVFIAVFVLVYIFDNLYKIKILCEKNGVNVCKINTFHLIILMLLLIAGGLVIVVSTTAYILLSGRKEV